MGRRQGHHRVETDSRGGVLVKCSRPNCPNSVRRQGVCAKHYDRLPARGYVDSGPTKARIELLLSRGIGWAGLEAAGISQQWWRQCGDRVQARVERKVLSIPVPERVIAGGTIPAIGTIRRLQALAAMGWPFTMIGPMLGHHERYPSQLMRRTVVLSSTAAKVDEVYRELAMKPGPSDWVRTVARGKGWQTAFAWDDIDNPGEAPDVGERVRVSRTEQIEELREIGVTDVCQIATRLGIQPGSVERQMYRAMGQAS